PFQEKKRVQLGHGLKPKPASSSTTVDPGMHKEDQQVTGGLTSLGVTSEERTNPQLSSGMSAFNLNEPIYSASFIIHSESALGNDASAVSIVEVDPGNFAPSDFVPQQQGINKRTKNTSYDHLFAGTDPHVLAEQTKSISEGLDTILAQALTGKGASSIARQVNEEEASITIKLEDLAKLVSNVQPSFKDLDSPKDDRVIIVESDAEEDDGIHSQKHKLELEKNKVTAEAEVALLKVQPSFPNVEQLNELLLNSLKTEFSNILSTHDFSSSLPTELNNLPSKFNKRTEEEKELKNQVHNLEIKLPIDLKEILTKLEDFTKTVASVQAKPKTLDTLLGLLSHVTKALNKFARVLDSASSKARDQSVLLVGQADTTPAEGEKNTNQATISQLFQIRAKKVNLNRPQPKTITPPPTPLVITTTTSQMQSPSFQPPPKSSSQPEGEHIKKDKGKKALYSEEAEKESTWL
ncbi:hypothetical protein Tco_0956313, partial [Tanacetum coccineum]